MPDRALSDLASLLLRLSELWTALTGRARRGTCRGLMVGALVRTGRMGALSIITVFIMIKSVMAHKQNGFGRQAHINHHIFNPAFAAPCAAKA